MWLPNEKFTLNGLIGGVLIGLLLITAITGLLWTPYDPMKLGFASRLAAPVPTIFSAPTNSGAMFSAA